MGEGVKDRIDEEIDGSLGKEKERCLVVHDVNSPYLIFINVKLSIVLYLSKFIIIFI